MSSIENIENLNIIFPVSDVKLRNVLITNNVCPQCGSQLSIDTKICKNNNCTHNARSEYDRFNNIRKERT